MLGGRYRALDLTGVDGAFCGKMLAELGMDVVKVEPPEGSAERRMGPFYQDQPHPERSLYWLAYNTSKRGITLNLRSTDGRHIFSRLVERADIVVESSPPGYLGKLGVGYPDLASINPGVIVVSITPFGQAGPRAHFAACDLTVLALGGLLNLNGDPDRAPLRFAIEQSTPQAGAQAAAATMIALHQRASTGRGQHVDVSMQEAVTEANFLQQNMWDVERKIQRREGTSCQRGNVAIRIVFPCQDGYVSWRIFVASMAWTTRALVNWMAEEGEAGELADVDFSKLDMNGLQQADVDRWEQVVAAFFQTHTKADLHEQALRRGVMLFPMADALDLLHDRQLESRDFWNAVAHPALGSTIRYPGQPYHVKGPRPPRPRPAPQLGEHNEEIYCGELGIAKDELTALKNAGVI